MAICTGGGGSSGLLGVLVHVVPASGEKTAVPAMSQPETAPASTLDEIVRATLQSAMLAVAAVLNRTKYLVERASLVAVAGAKLCSPLDAALPTRPTISAPGTSSLPPSVVLLWRANAGAIEQGLPMSTTTSERV